MGKDDKKMKIRDVMTKDPTRLEISRPVTEAAQVMQERSIGNVLVTRDSELVGVLTDRDIVLRCVAKGLDPNSATLEGIVSEQPTTLEADDDADKAVKLMVENSIRRIPVLDDGKPVGVVSLGDLAEHLDRNSALAEISASSPNN